MITSAEPVLFAAEFEPAHYLGRRRAPRRPVSLDARLGRGGLDRTLCKVTDVSIHGARLQTYSAIKRGSDIWLTLPGVGQVSATVRWSDDFEAGCEFHEPLSNAALRTLIDL
ncbi:PilZ domain-containing protein [Sphingomonas guangdongensis]|uniref:PilZ domain-containing protein n=1 Tax=Sphingomonas guangdongensis TaxID=1141890 RepID=A0A285R168_9SPHN|nr:PilZ domain-containing protein [Sphingomonas guangdongensis]SOB87846.1 PilZ domain-containing protein [Sphingomonas guangdongensis]